MRRDCPVSSNCPSVLWGHRLQRGGRTWAGESGLECKGGGVGDNVGQDSSPLEKMVDTHQCCLFVLGLPAPHFPGAGSPRVNCAPDVEQKGLWDYCVLSRFLGIFRNENIS